MISDWRTILLLPTGEKMTISLYPAGYIKLKISGPDRLAVEDMWHSQENGRQMTEVYLFPVPARPQACEEPPPRTFPPGQLNDPSAAKLEANAAYGKRG